MRIEQAVKVTGRAKTQIRDAVSSGVSFRSRYLDISKRAHAAIPASLPQRDRSYLRGYAEALLDNLHNTHAEFRYLVRGEWVNSGELDYGPNCTNRSGCEHTGCWVATHPNPPSAFFWKGTDRVFYQSIENVLGTASAE